MGIHRVALSSLPFVRILRIQRPRLSKAELSAPLFLFVFWRFLYWRCFGIQSTSFLPSAKLSLTPASRSNCMDIDFVLLRLCCVRIIELCAESAKDTSIVLILALWRVQTAERRFTASVKAIVCLGTS